MAHARRKICAMLGPYRLIFLIVLLVSLVLSLYLSAYLKKCHFDLRMDNQHDIYLSIMKKSHRLLGTSDRDVHAMQNQVVGIRNESMGAKKGSRENDEALKLSSSKNNVIAEGGTEHNKNQKTNPGIMVTEAKSTLQNSKPTVSDVIVVSNISPIVSSTDKKRVPTTAASTTNSYVTTTQRSSSKRKTLDLTTSQAIAATKNTATLAKPKVSTAKDKTNGPLNNGKPNKVTPTILAKKAENPTTPTTPQAKASSSSQNHVACEVPKLNPFHESVRPFSTWLKVKPRCPKPPKLGFVKNGFLYINVSRAQAATVHFMKRREGQSADFFLDNRPENSVSVIKHPRTKIALGVSGCLLTSDGEQLLAMNNAVSPLELEAPTKCDLENMVDILPNGRIQSIALKKCLDLKEFDSRGRLLVLSDCSKESPRFSVKDGLLFLDKKDCLKVRRDDAVVGVASNCNTQNSSKEIKFKIIRIQEQDLITKVKVRTDGVKLTVLRNYKLENQVFLTVTRKDGDYLKLNDTPKSPVNIVMIMFDSQSSSNFERLMRRTVGTLRNHSTSFIMKGHSVVGDATTAQLTPMLTGRAVDDLPEARRGYQNAKTVDGWPFIFKDLHQKGYVTLHTEDDPSLGAFNFRLHGFDKQPTTHYGRAFWNTVTDLATEPTSCLIDKFMHQYHLQYISSFYRAYPKEAKFAFSVSSFLCHDDPNKVQYADDDIANFFNLMRKHGHLNTTVVIIFGDHGSRLGIYRDTIVGKLEERLPFMAITVPERWRKEYPKVIRNLRHNSRVLTSHFDIYKTLQHLINGVDRKESDELKSLPGQSLLEKVDEKIRTCASAGIEEHWCPCLQFEPQNVTETDIIHLAKEVVVYINHLTRSVKDGGKLCSRFELDEIFRAGKKIPNKKVQTFVETDGTSSCERCVVVLDEKEKKKIKTFTYEVTFSVKPGGGKFEATVFVYKGRITVSSAISRINRYGNQPNCIKDKYPHLRKFCYCKS